MTTYLKQKPVKSCEQFHRKTLFKQANGTTYGGDFIESSIRGSNKKILQTHVFITLLKFSEVFMLLSIYYATEIFRSFHVTEVLMLLSIYYATEVFRSFHTTEVFMLLSIYYATDTFL